MKNATLLKSGLIGGVIAGVCCFTPALVVALAAVGMSAALAWLDFVLLPALAISVAVTIFALARMRADRSEAEGTRS